MLATVVVSLAVGALSRDTIYTLKLSRRGVALRSGRDLNVMRALKVADAMRTEVEAVREDMTVGDAVELMQRTRHTGYPILDREGRLCGIITLGDIRDVRVGDRLSVPLSEVSTRDLITVTPEEDLEPAMHKLSYGDVGRLPVVDAADPRRLVGLITRSDIIRAYDRALLHEDEPPAREE